MAKSKKSAPSIIVDILIIGGGPAGLTAGIYAARSEAKTVIIEQTICGGQVTQTLDVENMPGFLKIGGAELALEMTGQAENAGCEIFYEEIKNIELGTQHSDFSVPVHKVVTEDNTFIAKSVIIATGAGPRRLTAKNQDNFHGRGIHYCGLCDGSFYKNKRVIVVGGGNSAVEEVLYLSNIAKEVTIVNVTPNFNAQAVLVERLKTVYNYKAAYHNHTVEEILSDESGVLTGILVKEKGGKLTTLEADGVFVAIGRVPNTAFLKEQITLSEYGYIVADAKMRTNIDGVFAAGDVIDKQIRQIVTACSDGAMAATNAEAYVRCHVADVRC